MIYLSMNFIKLTDFIKLEKKPFLLGNFLSRIQTTVINNKEYFYTYSYNRASKYVFKSDFDLDTYNDELIQIFNKESGYHNWHRHKREMDYIDIRFYILNDCNFSFLQFYNLIIDNVYKIITHLQNNTYSEDAKSFIRGFFESRGSVDIIRKYLAQDYYYDDRNQLKKALVLTNHFSIPEQFINFNLRELQPDFTTGKNKRNTQLRLNLNFYASKIGFMNKYKALIYEKGMKAEKPKIIDSIYYYPNAHISDKFNSSQFFKRLNFFTNSIYENKLTDSVVSEFRSLLKFDSNDKTDNKKSRNMNIIKIYKEISEDECALCKKTKTFTSKSTNRQYFEIHHVLPFHSDENADNFANLVKLCPECHRKLKKNAADKNEQIQSIIIILTNRAIVFEYLSAIFNTSNIIELANIIYERLG